LSHQHEHEFEAAPGLPETLPVGEKILWQGGPDWRQLAVHAFHVRKLAVYFALMIGLQAMVIKHQPFDMILASLMTSAMLALTAVGMLTGIAWFASHTCLYTLTNKRVVMRIGIVLTMTFNLPLVRLAGAAIKARGRGCGDIALTIKQPDRIAYLHLWPHARAWHLKNPQPSLRCVARSAEVSELILQAWRSANPGEATCSPVAAEPARGSGQGLSAPLTA
jgi:hypothetical protein